MTQNSSPAQQTQWTQKYQDCLRYIEAYWPKILRYQVQDSGTLIGLPNPYLVPNHQMFQEQFYWDSYFIMRGLRQSPHAKLVVDMTENFLALLRRFGRIPNASRFYFLSRSQPPFLTSMILKSYQTLIESGTPTAQAQDWLRQGMQLAKFEYDNVWCAGQFPDERNVFSGLSRYFDINIWHHAAEAESGWDMTPRFENRCLDFLPVDLNCLLYKYEIDFIVANKITGDTSSSEEWLAKAETRKATVNKLMWHDPAGYYFDYDYRAKRRSSFKSLAGFFALWSGLASTEQAARIVQSALPWFETDFGVVTSEEWHPSSEDDRKQWAWPNGWAPLQTIVVNGLLRYGYTIEALRIATKWLDLVDRVFQETQVNFEKYDVVRGTRARSERYPDQPGFGWTNAVFVEFVQLVSDAHTPKSQDILTIHQ